MRSHFYQVLSEEHKRGKREWFNLFHITHTRTHTQFRFSHSAQLASRTQSILADGVEKSYGSCFSNYLAYVRFDDVFYFLDTVPRVHAAFFKPFPLFSISTAIPYDGYRADPRPHTPSRPRKPLGSSVRPLLFVRSRLLLFINVTRAHYPHKYHFSLSRPGPTTLIDFRVRSRDYPERV